MTPEELNRMTLEEAQVLFQRAAAQQSAEDSAKVRAAIESGGRSVDAGDVVRKYVVETGKNARDEYKERNSIPAWRPVSNEELGWGVTSGDIDLALFRIREAGWTRTTVQEEVRKLATKSGGILDAEQLLKHWGVG
jgi:hypothetical protein